MYLILLLFLLSQDGIKRHANHDPTFGLAAFFKNTILNFPSQPRLGAALLLLRLPVRGPARGHGKVPQPPAQELPPRVHLRRRPEEDQHQDLRGQEDAGRGDGERACAFPINILILISRFFVCCLVREPPSRHHPGPHGDAPLLQGLLPGAAVRQPGTRISHSHKTYTH